MARTKQSIQLTKKDQELLDAQLAQVRNKFLAKTRAERENSKKSNSKPVSKHAPKNPAGKKKKETTAVQENVAVHVEPVVRESVPGRCQKSTKEELKRNLEATTNETVSDRAVNQIYLNCRRQVGFFLQQKYGSRWWEKEIADLKHDGHLGELTEVLDKQALKCLGTDKLVFIASQTLIDTRYEVHRKKKKEREKKRKEKQALDEKHRDRKSKKRKEKKERKKAEKKAKKKKEREQAKEERKARKRAQKEMEKQGNAIDDQQQEALRKAREAIEENQRQELERLENERRENERLENERLEKERLENEKNVVAIAPKKNQKKRRKKKGW